MVHLTFSMAVIKPPIKVLRHQVADLEDSCSRLSKICPTSAVNPQELCKSPALSVNDRRLYEQEICVMQRQQAGWLERFKT